MWPFKRKAAKAASPTSELSPAQQKALRHAQIVLHSFRTGEERALNSALMESGLQYRGAGAPWYVRMRLWVVRKLRSLRA